MSLIGRLVHDAGRSLTVEASDTDPAGIVVRADAAGERAVSGAWALEDWRRLNTAVEDHFRRAALAESGRQADAEIRA